MHISTELAQMVEAAKATGFKVDRIGRVIGKFHNVTEHRELVQSAKSLRVRMEEV